MSAPLPISTVVTGEYRALTLYDTVPPDCGAERVPDGSFAPHLKAGELAVIDPDDNRPVTGEIYLVEISSPTAPDGYRLRFVQLSRSMMRLGTIMPGGRAVPDAEDSVAWWMRFGLSRPSIIRTFHTMEEAEESLSSMVVSDGPMREEGIRSVIVGRVIAVIAIGGIRPIPWTCVSRRGLDSQSGPS